MSLPESPPPSTAETVIRKYSSGSPSLFTSQAVVNISSPEESSSSNSKAVVDMHFPESSSPSISKAIIKTSSPQSPSASTSIVEVVVKMSSFESASPSASEAVVDSTRKSFLDLPPEIRLEIYRALFQGQAITIRGKDGKFKGKGSRKKWLENFPRDRAMGLSILFAAKVCLAEAKPILLSLATFDINFKSMLHGRHERYLRHLQGFGRAELAHIRSMEMSNIAFAGQNGFVRQLSAMPFLYDVVLSHVDGRGLRCVGRRVEEMKEDARWTVLVNKMLSIFNDHCRWRGHRAIQQHIKKVAEQGKHHARFLLKLSVWFENAGAIAHADFLAERIWFVDRFDEADILMPTRAEPRLFDPFC